MNTITVASINIWNFNHWKKRLPPLTSVLKKLNADVIFFQEVQHDISQDAKNQLDILNTYLLYPHTLFSKSSIKTKRKEMLLPNPIEHGLGLLSKIPFTSEIIPLRTFTEKESRIIQLVTFETLIPLSFAHVHFSNSDITAEIHLKETLDLFIDKNVSLIGDFNIKDLKKYSDLYTNKYISSYDYTNYISYPEDNLSYDYILLSKKHSFKNFSCLPEKVSDHRIITSTIHIF